MKAGLRIYDTDTHIDPGADVLEKYVDPEFRPRLDDLAPYRRATQSRSEDRAVRHTYRFGQKAWDILCSPAAQKAFDLDSEPAELREKYGFMPSFDPGAANRCGQTARNGPGSPAARQSASASSETSVRPTFRQPLAAG